MPRARCASEREWSVHTATARAAMLAMTTITKKERPVAGRRPGDLRCAGGGDPADALVDDLRGLENGIDQRRLEALEGLSL